MNILLRKAVLEHHGALDVAALSLEDDSCKLRLDE